MAILKKYPIELNWNGDKRAKQKQEPILFFSAHINYFTLLGDRVHADHPVAFQALKDQGGGDIAELTENREGCRGILFDIDRERIMVLHDRTLRVITPN